MVLNYWSTGITNSLIGSAQNMYLLEMWLLYWSDTVAEAADQDTRFKMFTLLQQLSIWHVVCDDYVKWKLTVLF